MSIGCELLYPGSHCEHSFQFAVPVELQQWLSDVGVVHSDLYIDLVTGLKFCDDLFWDLISFL